jgi:hypothetical protein
MGDPPPVAGGFTNSSEVAPASLVVHLPFDGDITDVKGGLSAAPVMEQLLLLPAEKARLIKAPPMALFLIQIPAQ